MDSRGLSRRLHSLLETVEGKQNLVGAVTALDRQYNELSTVLSKPPLDTPDILFKNIVELLNPGIKSVRALPFGSIFPEIADLCRALPGYSDIVSPGAETPIEKLQASLVAFRDRLESVLQHHQRSEFVKLLFHAHELAESISALATCKAIIDSNLLPTTPKEEDRQNLSIKLFYSIEYAETVTKLKLLGDIYEELLRLGGISTVDATLRISKLESGSLWAVLSGDSKIMDLMADLIKSTGKAIYERFTNQGITWGVRTMGELFELRERYRQAGIDTTVVDAEFEDASVLLVRKTAALFRGEPRVEINDEEISIAPTVRVSYVEESRRQLLPGGGQMDEPRADQD
jgi:hypothetical protein